MPTSRNRAAQAGRARRFPRQYADRAGVVRPIASDSFNRPDSASLGSTDGLAVPEFGGSGVAWTAASGTWGIFSNTLRCTASGNAIVDLGVADAWIEAQFFGATTGNATSILFRYTDASNHWRFFMSNTAMTLQPFSGGSGGSVLATASITPRAGDTYRLSLNGTAIAAYHLPLSGPRTVISGTSSTHQSATISGFRTVDANFRFTKFVAWSANTLDWPGY